MKTFEKNKSRAVVLLSGGLDSTTTLAIAQDLGYQTYALTINYGQRHHAELAAAKRVGEYFNVTEHKVLSLDLTLFGGSALTDQIPVPKESVVENSPSQIPITYVPARNTIMLSLALAYAEVVGAEHIFIGVTAVDYSGYPDCRPVFIEAFQRLAQLATKAGVSGTPLRIVAPLISKTKAEIIQTGLNLGVDYSITHSCYDPDSVGLACGECESCQIRKLGFNKAGIDDPTKYSQETGRVE